MKALRIIGVIILVAGGILIGVSQHIKTRVAEGRIEISSGERKVETGQKLFGATPVTKEAGNTLFFNSANQQIAEGKSEADRYEALANQLQIGGIAAIIVGAGCILWSFIKKKKR